MADLKDLAMKKERLAAIDAEIAAAQQTFEESIAALRREREAVRREYESFLRAELASLDGRAAPSPSQRAPRGSAPKPDAEKILAAIEKAQIPVSVERVRELAGIPRAVSSNAMSSALKKLVDEGKVRREGQRRGTRYSVR